MNVSFASLLFDFSIAVGGVQPGRFVKETLQVKDTINLKDVMNNHTTGIR